jgi:hypothetical protein
VPSESAGISLMRGRILVYIGENQGGWKRTLVEEIGPDFEKAIGIKVEFTLLDAWQARPRVAISRSRSTMRSASRSRSSFERSLRCGPTGRGPQRPDARSAVAKGFGCRPVGKLSARTEGRRPKACKEGTRGKSAGLADYGDLSSERV